MRQINTQLTRDKVVAELRREIMCGELQAHQELFQDKIADELGVSRLPVREALQILHNDGLVTVRPNKVATVNEISGKFLDDYFEIRILLEQEAIRRVLKRKIDCSILWEYYNRAEEAITRHNFEAFDNYNYRFHAAIWHESDNIQLERFLSQMWNTLISGSDSDSTQKSARESNMDHKLIIKSIEADDEEKALHFTALHIQRNYQRILLGLTRNK